MLHDDPILFTSVLRQIVVAGIVGPLCIPTALYLLIEDHAFGVPQTESISPPPPEYQLVSDFQSL
ncbi:hypothetical protein NC651_034382 [Populus alba x Populus x berolinensis]|nr:hypothetical protein NC651_034382 [Populus alba x Populus x berolinensis]